MTSKDRKYIEVVGFEELQNSKRPKRPSWFKAFTAELEELDYLGLSLTNRGFLIDMQRLAATMGNRIPNDVRFIARRLNQPPRVIGKALTTCITQGFLSESDEPADSRKNSSLNEKSDARKASQRERGGEEIRGDKTRIERIAFDFDADELAQAVPETIQKDIAKSKLPDPTPNPCASKKHVTKPFACAVKTVNGRKRDKRPFDDLKARVLEAAVKLNTDDPDQIEKLAGQSLKMSTKQIVEAVRQLKEDGKL